MQKIPTLYVRDSTDRAHVTDEVTPGCEWVVAGEGLPTKKYDGTCVMYDNHSWYARREVRAGNPLPRGFVQLNEDPETGKRIGWEPIEQSGYNKHFKEALTHWLDETDGVYPYPGTYELCGPKISNKSHNKNPEKLDRHELFRHQFAPSVVDALTIRHNDVVQAALCTEDPKQLVVAVGKEWGWEGLVWHHENGSMVKLKEQDLL